MPGAFEGVLEPGMVLCVESLISRAGGDFSIKLEEQVLVSETGPGDAVALPADPALAAAPCLEAPRPFPYTQAQNHRGRGPWRPD